ncbi:MAG: di-heme oxidoredictase family protein [Polyangiaceae bacterium]
MSFRAARFLVLSAMFSAIGACGAPSDTSSGGGGATTSSTTAGGGGAGGDTVQADVFDVPIDDVTPEQQEAFFAGDTLFELILHEADGLGPLYTRASCGACHDKGVRGPGSVQKMAVVDADGVTPSVDQSMLPYGHTVHPLTTAGAQTAILPPDDPSVKVTLRVGPPVLGRGYLEAIDDAEILARESEQASRPDSIHGKVNHVVYQSEPNPDPTFNAHQPGDMVIGRFGTKARIATLDEFTADALQGDMGITSPLRPTEFLNPDGLTDDLKVGVDVTADSVNKRAMYVRLTAIPRRDGLSEDAAKLFADAKCDVCHAPTMKTRKDYPIAQLAGIDAPVFTDMLLHDMGPKLADGMVDGQASSRQWRTSPLIGLRFNKTFLHDGRVKTVEDAILAHDDDGSEGAESASLYKNMSGADRAALLAYVSAL